MEQAGERDRLFDGLPESPRAEPRPPVKGTFTRTGILPSQALKSLIAGGEIRAAPEIGADQIQPASLDLRLGKVAYRIRASFLPGPNATVRDKLAELKFHEIDLTHGAVLEAGCVYLVPLIEQLNSARHHRRLRQPEKLDRPHRRVHPADRRPAGFLRCGGGGL